jgi:CRP-like cAMP-binding protein
MVVQHDLGPIIDEHPFFRGIDGKLRALLVGCAANERFDAGMYLTREGEPANKFYLIRAGQVAVEIDTPGRQPIIVETLNEGEVTGWSWIVPPYRSTFDARATSPVRVISFDGKCLRAKMEADPVLGYEVMQRFVRMMAHRIAGARLQLLDLYGPVGGGRRETGQ